MKEITGKLNAAGMRLAVVVSRFNSFFAEQLMKGAQDCFLRHGGVESEFTLVRVPGANELPLIAKKLAESGKFDAVVLLGTVVQGATTHAELINTTVARAALNLTLSSGMPIINGVICAHNLEQAIERAGSKHGNKGWDAVLAAIETVQVLKAL